MLRFEENFVYGDAGAIQANVRMGIWDVPHGPEPGPDMPKKKRPQIL